MRPLLAFLTDFGTRDHYAGTMKAVALGICPEATLLDITPVGEQKLAAMASMGAQEYLRQYYTERAGHRANHARRISGATDVRYAEAFQRVLPQLVRAL